MIVMGVIETVRHRRKRARRRAGHSGRFLRAAAIAGIFLLAALLFLPLAGLAAGTAGLLVFARELPDAGALEQLPAHYQPSTAATRLFAWGSPDAGGLRQPYLIDEITDPRAAGAAWVRAGELPAQIFDALAAGIDPQGSPDPPPPLVNELAGWWRTGVTPAPPSGLARDLILTHLRSEEPGTPGDTTRAVQDWFLGRQIDTRYTREQQLEWVLNTRYYGNLAYGIDGAAWVYFGKRAAELTLGEAAMLATVAQDPAANPFDDPEAAGRGQSAVLATLVATGTLSAGDAAAAAAEGVTLAPPPGSDSTVLAFARLARRQLEAILGPEALLAGDLAVETTLDLALQGQVECVLATQTGQPAGSGGGPPCPALEYLPPSAEAVATDGAVIALNPATGEIEALAGDAPADSSRPLGTLVQPLIYLTALSQGYTAATLTMDVPSIYLQDGRPYSPRNNDGAYTGPLRLREAMATGRTVPATQLFSWIGIDQLRETVEALGLEPTEDEVSADLTFPEHGFPATLADLGRAFAAIGNGGAMTGLSLAEESPRSTTIRSVVDSAGRPVYTYEPATREILSAELAYLMTDILSDAEARCGGGDCPDWLAPLAAKGAAVATGESPEGDAWSIGYTPERLIGVWTGGDATGESAAAGVWSSLMAWAFADSPAAEWPRPFGLRPVDVCELSGLLPSRGGDCPTVREWFVPGTEPAEVDTMVREVAINRETGRLATMFTPPQLVERRTYVVYPPEAAAWAEAAGIESPPTEYDTIRRVATTDGGAAVLSPEPWELVSGQWPVTGSAGGDGFDYYRLAYFPGLLPEAMQNLVERGETPVESAELAVWDTSLLDDGLYTLLLTVVRQDGTFDEVAIPVTVANGG